MKKVIFSIITLVAAAGIAFAADAKKSTKDYLADLAPAKDEKTIVEAAQWLGNDKEKDAIPGLIKLLSDKRDNVRLNSVMALGYIEQESAAEEVNKIFLNKDEKAEIRYAAVLASFRIGSKKSLDAWKQAKENESDPFIKDFLKKMEEKATGK